MLQETQISRFYFNRDHAVKLQRKYAKINIFHILNHKSIINWVSEIPVQWLGSLECYLDKKHILRVTNVL